MNSNLSEGIAADFYTKYLESDTPLTMAKAMSKALMKMRFGSTLGHALEKGKVVRVQDGQDVSGEFAEILHHKARRALPCLMEPLNSALVMR
jgi:hypothetical protein